MKHEKKRTVPLKCPALFITPWYLMISLSFLFLLQSYRELYSSTYYYSLVGMGLSGATTAVLVMFIPLLTPLLTRYLRWRGAVLIPGAALVASRAPMSLGLEAPFHLIFSLIAFSSASIVLTLALALHRRERSMDPDAFSSQGFAGALSLAFMLIITLNAAGFGQDVSIVLKPSGVLLSPLIGCCLSGALGLVLLLVRKSPNMDDERGESGEAGYVVKGGIADSWTPALGLGGFLFLSFTLIPYPIVTSLWSGGEPHWALSMTLASIALFIMSLFSGSGILITVRRGLSTPKGAIMGNIMMLVGAMNLFYFGIELPSAPAGMVFIGLVDLWMILDAMTDTKPFKGELIEVGPEDKRRLLGFMGSRRVKRSPDVFGHTMTMANVIAFVLAICLALSVNWAHAPTGTLLKGNIQLLMMVGMVALAVGGFSCSKAAMDEPSPKVREELHLGKSSPATAAGKGSGKLHSGTIVSGRLKVQWLTIGALTILLIFASMGLSILMYELDEVDEEIEKEVKVATYNIHQGFSNDGRVDLVPALEELEAIDADVVFLQESEGAWPHTGVVDPVFFLAQRLGMNMVRGPEIKEGIFGVSILSRTPLFDPKVHFLDSREDQRVAVTCRTSIGGRTMNLISVHIGLSEQDRRVQVRQLADIVGELEGEVMIGGDFNTGPQDPIMAPMNSTFFGGGNTTSLGLMSAWHTAEHRNADLNTSTFPAVGLDLPREHIDYILFSPVMRCLEAGIEDGASASDHKPLWAVLQL